MEEIKFNGNYDTLIRDLTPTCEEFILECQFKSTNVLTGAECCGEYFGSEPIINQYGTSLCVLENYFEATNLSKVSPPSIRSLPPAGNNGPEPPSKFPVSLFLKFKFWTAHAVSLLRHLLFNCRWQAGPGDLAGRREQRTQGGHHA